MIAHIHQAKRSVVVLRENQKQGFGHRRRIDVWWGGMQANGGLMLLLAYLITKDRDWRNAKTYLKLVVHDETAAAAARKNLEAMLKQLRIEAIPRILVSQGRSFDEILHRSSQNADLVFMGMKIPGDDFTQYYDNLQARTANLPTTLFVLAAADFAFSEVLSES